MDSKAKVNKIPADTIGIRFSVEMENAEEEYVPESWLDHDMFASWIAYYEKTIEDTFPWDYCYVNGDYVPITTKHSNGIRTNSDFAKLLSANENGLLTYTGHRFKTSGEAVTVGYVTSLKAHNALRWLISLQGLRNGENITLAWRDSGQPVLVPYYADTPTAYGYSELEAEQKLFQSAEEYFNHLDEMAKMQEDEDGCIHFLELDSSFKGDLKGRIAVLDYQVYTAREYYRNIYTWHRKYFWNINKGKNSFTGCPSIRDFIVAAYGIESNEMLTVYAKTMYAMLYNRIVKCVILGYDLPDDIIKQLCSHASTPMKYPKTRGRVWSIACAAINGKEGRDIMLDKNCMDRDYLFGRLLAVANYAERQTFKPEETARETNAIRYMADYANMPATTWDRLFVKLQPYLRKLNRDKYYVGELYRRQINEIVSMIAKEDFNDEKLGPGYLLGFSSQSAELSKRQPKENGDDKSDADEE